MVHVVEDHNMIYPSALSPASGHMSWQSTYYATLLDLTNIFEAIEITVIDIVRVSQYVRTAAARKVSDYL